MLKKVCTKCKLEKNYSEFLKDNRTKTGLYSDCKKCHYNYNKNWIKNNPQTNKDCQREYRKKETAKEYQRKYRFTYIRQEKFKEYHRKYMAQWIKTPKNRIDFSMRTSIWSALKGNKARRSWKRLVKYTLKDLILHLEKQFDDKMNWKNYGSYWEIDHIKPRSLFKYKTAEDLEFEKCWALANLRPLSKRENRMKSNKYSLEV